jgi:hypothetical protein
VLRSAVRIGAGQASLRPLISHRVTSAGVSSYPLASAS